MLSGGGGCGTSSESRNAMLDEPGMLARYGAGEHGIEALTPEVALDADIGEIYGV